MIQGVIYQLCGPSYAELLATSLWSLRKHYSGPVCLYVTDPDSGAVATKLAGDGRLRPLNVKAVDPPKVRRHGKYTIKPLLSLLSPFDATILLDADTLVIGDISPLFEHRLTVTDFCQWKTIGRRIKGRINQWKGLSPWIDAMVEYQLELSRPAINTGMIAFRREAREDLQLWANLTMIGQRCSFTDEIAMQLLLGEVDHRLVDDRWNCSVHLGIHQDAAVIRHFHGRSHVRREDCRVVWWPHFEEAIEAKAGGLDEWAGQYDAGVSRLMNGTASK